MHMDIHRHHHVHVPSRVPSHEEEEDEGEEEDILTRTYHWLTLPFLCNWVCICPVFSFIEVNSSINLSECMLLPTYPTALKSLGCNIVPPHSDSSQLFFGPSTLMKQTQFGMKSFMHKSNSKQSFCFSIVNAEFWEGGYSGHCYWNVIVVNWLNFDLICH